MASSSCAVGHFAQPTDNDVKAAPRARALYLQAAAEGVGLKAESLDAANDLLTTQGPIGKQTLTLVPLSPAGERVAPRLARALRDAGARVVHLGVYEVQGGAESEPGRELARQQEGWDVELISEAVVVEIPDCTVAKPDEWTVSPFESVGTLGCASNANIAAMISDPRDLLRPRVLGPADGKVAESAVKRYRNDEIKDLIDIDFSGDD